MSDQLTTKDNETWKKFKDGNEEHDNQPQLSTCKGIVIHRRCLSSSITINCRLFLLPLTVTFIHHFCLSPQFVVVTHLMHTSPSLIIIFVVSCSRLSLVGITRYWPLSLLLFIAVVHRSLPSHALAVSTGFHHHCYHLSPSHAFVIRC